MTEETLQQANRLSKKLATKKDKLELLERVLSNKNTLDGLSISGTDVGYINLDSFDEQKITDVINLFVQNIALIVQREIIRDTEKLKVL
ncbi:MAG: hypothetical protein KAS32_14535 [Candidatus Peribacteraceae bacterium]|nr:hypothetical protein [Candidatus Peribacteraceae bacterium]